MRTVSQIIGACQDLAPATEEELRLAVLALHYAMGLHRPVDPENMSRDELLFRHQDRLESEWRMLRSDPAVWLGERWTPGTEENSSMRKVSKAVLAEVARRRSST